MIAFQAVFHPEYLKGDPKHHAAYEDGVPILVEQFRESFDEFYQVISFLNQWLNQKIIQLTLSELIGLPAILKDAISIYFRERSEYDEERMK